MKPSLKRNLSRYFIACVLILGSPSLMAKIFECTIDKVNQKFISAPGRVMGGKITYDTTQDSWKNSGTMHSFFVRTVNQQTMTQHMVNIDEDRKVFTDYYSVISTAGGDLENKVDLVTGKCVPK